MTPSDDGSDDGYYWAYLEMGRGGAWHIVDLERRHIWVPGFADAWSVLKVVHWGPRVVMPKECYEKAKAVL